MTLRLKINHKLDEKLAQQFQQDPYADLTINLQNTTIRLSLAYLSLDSQWFAELTPQPQPIDLSSFDQDATIAVLRSLYGGPLECSSPSDFQLIWPLISFLQIEDYRKNAQEGIRSWLQKRQGGQGSIEWIQVSLSCGLLKNWIVEWLSSQHLRLLESTKNYLQLGKLSDESLNFILMQYLKKEDAKTPVVNTILQNYFNRKAHSPIKYFQKPELASLKEVWEKHHHRLKGIKMQKITSIQNLIATTSQRGREEGYEPKTATRAKKISLADFNCVSMNLTGNAFQGEKNGNLEMLNVRLSVLSNELQQKNKRIELLREELQELEDLKAKRVQEDQALNEETMLDIVLLKSRMKSKREKHLHQEVQNQYALDNPCRRMLEQEKNKVPSVKQL